MGLFDAKQAGNTAQPGDEFAQQMVVLQQRKENLIHSIGQMYVENNTLEDAEGTIYEEPIKQINQIEEDLTVLEKRRLASQGLRKCEKCGNVLTLDSVFCNKCGDKLAPLFVPTQENPYICPKCGASHEAGVSFCVNCGNKLI